MLTRIVKVDAQEPDLRLLAEPAEALRRGELVAFPTETVYGLGGAALNAATVARIFAVKDRPADNPLIIHLSEPSLAIDLTTGISEFEVALMARFMPGPFTLVLPRHERVPDIVSAGQDTVAIRCPENPVAQALMRLTGIPLAAPSANRSGRPSPTVARDVAEDLDGKIPYIVDGGACQIGIESTVVIARDDYPIILRPGLVTREMLADFTAEYFGVERAEQNRECAEASQREQSRSQAPPLSPGQKYRHYAPRARLEIFTGDDSGARAKDLRARLERYLSVESPQEGVERLVGLFISSATLEAFKGGLSGPTALSAELRPEVIVYAAEPDPSAAAHELFAALRSFDRVGAAVIFAEGLSAGSGGEAYMNRLRRAAGGGAEEDE
ncbi:MAG: threonylcarbamoyl-AMP synthase [Clostridiaceae bacterium]|nr:threonylcarbamoyl-AMP synthase [Clostridiaceae bacterium]